jgi:ribosomal protein S27AE
MGTNTMICDGCGTTEEVASDDLPLECGECGSTEFSPSDGDPPLP